MQSALPAWLSRCQCDNRPIRLSADSRRGDQPIPALPLVKRVSSPSVCPAPACSWSFLTLDAVDVHA
jgi:hypothetical protein